MTNDVFRKPTADEENFLNHVNRLTIGNSPALTAIGKVVCVNAGTIWPDQLVGFDRAGEAARQPVGYLTPIELAPSRAGHVVRGRRIAWHLAGRLTDEAPDTVAEAFGTHNPAYVGRFMRDFEHLAMIYDREHRLPERIAELAMMVQVELEVGNPLG